VCAYAATFAFPFLKLSQSAAHSDVMPISVVAKNEYDQIAGQRQRGIGDSMLYVQSHGTHASEPPAAANMNKIGAAIRQTPKHNQQSVDVRGRLIVLSTPNV